MPTVTPGDMRPPAPAGTKAPGGSRGGGRRGRLRLGLAAAAAAVAVAIIYLIVAMTAHLPPFGTATLAPSSPAPATTAPASTGPRPSPAAASPATSPDDLRGHVPGDLPRDLPGHVPATSPADVPAGVPGRVPAGVPAGVPGHVPAGPPRPPHRRPPRRGYPCLGQLRTSTSGGCAEPAHGPIARLRLVRSHPGGPGSARPVLVGQSHERGVAGHGVSQAHVLQLGQCSPGRAVAHVGRSRPAR